MLDRKSKEQEPADVGQQFADRAGADKEQSADK